MKPKDVIAKYGVSDTLVYKIGKGAAAPSEAPRRKPRPTTLDYDGILADLKQGLSNAEISARRNCSANSIGIFAVANGFTGRTIRLDHEGILADLRAGLVYREIAERRNASVDRISDIAKANGLGRQAPRIPQEVREAVIADVKAGLTHEETAARHGLTRRGVGEIATRAGLGKSVRERLALSMQPAGESGYSADTEILTRTRGWVPVTQLTLFDEVAARTPGKRFTWEHPEAVTVRRYRGEMIAFKGKPHDLLVGPGHPMPWTREGGSRGREYTSRAAAIADAPGGCLVATSTWDAPDLGHKVFTSLNEARRGPASRKVFMTGDQYAAFMGMYIAEGCALQVKDKDWRVLISQTAGGKGWAEFRELLTKIFGREPGRTSGAWAIYSRALAQNLIPLGHATVKYIPADVLGMSRRQLEIFWRYYWLGDGARAGGEMASTASALLAGGLQEVIQKIGLSTSVIKFRTKPNPMVTTSSAMYKVGIRQNPYPKFTASRVPYSGLIADIQVPAGPVYVRRNGRAIWAGA